MSPDLGRSERRDSDERWSRNAYFWMGYVVGIIALGITVIVMHAVGL
jgi:hypothetical protein